MDAMVMNDDVFDKPAPISAALMVISVFLGAVIISIWLVWQIVDIILNHPIAASTTPFALVPIGLTLLFGIAVSELFYRNVLRTSKARNKQVIRFTVYVCYFCIFALVSAPIIVRPVMTKYITSQGYLACNEGHSALTRIYWQYWAKPSVGCEIWDLDYKERDAILDEFRAEKP